jgi:N-acetylneuraminic acid mutarotase
LNSRYIITGDFSKQVLEYDPVTDRWTQKGDFPGEERTAAAGFVINGKGYISGGGPGKDGGFADLWEYDATTDEWTRRADMKLIGYEGIGFSVSGKGYVGNTNGAYKQLWEYDPSNDKWTKKKHFPGKAVSGCVSFVINNVAYVATGSLSNDVSNEIWKFEPE